MRKMLKIMAVLCILLSAFFMYSKVARGRRDSAYREKMAPFRRDLHAGTARLEVERYFHQHDLIYNAIDEGKTYLIQIAEEPSWEPWCEPWDVNVAFEFDSSDRLTEIHIRKFGTCL
ncbi:MAG TPA: hypothetical protein VK466_05685 [Terriglobales bacterium]|nr:hypothetical protein [Terriglobales bacterium]